MENFKKGIQFALGWIVAHIIIYLILFAIIMFILYLNGVDLSFFQY